MSEALNREGASESVRGDAKAILAASTLPDAAKDLIVQVVRRTRLWRREKAAVASELVAHFEDGLEAGRSAGELISSFGNIKTAARLMRRGKVRNRALWWRVQRRICQAFIAFVLLYVGAAGVLVLRQPNPRIDYVAEMNRPILATPLPDRAWPIYRDAWTKARIWDLPADELYVREPNHTQGRALRPGDSGWPEAAAFLRQQKPLFDAMREAAIRPSLGWELKSGGLSVLSPEDRALFGRNLDRLRMPVPLSRADQLMAQSLNSVLLPYIGVMRHTVSLLAADLRLAATEGDADRALADYRAIVGMAQQCGQTPFLICQRIRLDMLSLADGTLAEINQSAPASLSRCRIELLHTMASAEAMFKLDLTVERMSLLDMIQRVYSDNGHGDGSPTLDGMELLTRLHSSSSRELLDVGPAETARMLAMPTAVAAMASRKELTDQVDQLFALSQQDVARPLWVKLHSAAAADALVRSWAQSSVPRIRYAPLVFAFPSFDGVARQADQKQALHEATMVALALDACRDKTGRYPATLAELVPHYLPAMPLDYSTGGPLRYKLVDGKPLLYGLGKDGVDDGGVWAKTKFSYWPSVPDTGDWVLYPPVEEPQQ